MIRGLALEWVDEPSILSVKFTENSPHIIHQWEKELIERIHALSPGQPFHYLHDASGFGLAAFTPGVQRSAIHIMNRSHHHPGRTAIVISQPLLRDLVKLFLHMHINERRERRVFMTRDAALSWLRESVVRGASIN